MWITMSAIKSIKSINTPPTFVINNSNGLHSFTPKMKRVHSVCSIQFCLVGCLYIWFIMQFFLKHIVHDRVHYAVYAHFSFNSSNVKLSTHLMRDLFIRKIIILKHLTETALTFQKHRSTPINHKLWSKREWNVYAGYYSKKMNMNIYFIHLISI